MGALARLMGALLTHNTMAGTPVLINSYAFTYDGANRIDEMTVGAASYSGESVDYDYDGAGQLTASDYGSSTPLVDTTYGYDENGNRTALNGSGSYVYDDDNRLTNDGTFSYEYDDEGNLIQRIQLVSGQPSGETYEYDWDHRNRLIEARILDAPSGNLQTVVQYDYDWMNQLVGKRVDENVDGTTDRQEFYIHDAGQMVLQFDGTGIGDVSHRHLWGAAVDQLLATENVTTDDVYWPLADRLGTIRDIVSHDDTSAGTTSITHRVYDTFGNLVDEDLFNGQQTGPVTTITDLIFGYTGRQFDSDVGLQNNLNRWYDTPTGRWLSEDPIGFAAGDANLYRYVGNGVTEATDPSRLIARE